MRLPRPARVAEYLIALYGTYGNWLTTTLAAIFGTASFNSGCDGRPCRETQAGSFGRAPAFLGVSISIVPAAMLVLYGLRARAAQGERQMERTRCTFL